jgi:hypothetical protein
MPVIRFGKAVPVARFTASVKMAHAMGACQRGGRRGVRTDVTARAQGVPRSSSPSARIDRRLWRHDCARRWNHSPPRHSSSTRPSAHSARRSPGTDSAAGAPQPALGCRTSHSWTTSRSDRRCHSDHVALGRQSPVYALAWSMVRSHSGAPCSVLSPLSKTARL